MKKIKGNNKRFVLASQAPIKTEPKVTNSPSDISPDISPDISSDTDTMITNEILNSSLKKYQTAANEDFFEYKTNIDTLNMIIKEYLNDFIVIGHNVLGQRVFLRYAKNPKEIDALTELFKKTFFKTMSEEENGIG